MQKKIPHIAMKFAESYNKIIMSSENTTDKTQPETSFKGVIILLVTAIIWGSSFVSQSVGSKSVEPFTFMGIRTLIGATFLVPFIIITKRKVNLKTILCGTVMGLFLCVATNIQQFAFNYSTAGKIAFCTASYMFFIPVAELFIGKKAGKITWLCVLLGFCGLYFLCFKGGDDFSLNRGDLLAVICALFFTGQIMCIDKFTEDCDGIVLSCVEFYTAGIITTILMLIFEKPEWQGIKSAGTAILYSGLMSCGIAYTLQVIGQKYCEATIASLLMCMESVFAVITSAIMLHEKLTGREILGSAIMFSAIVISQLAPKFTAKKEARG